MMIGMKWTGKTTSPDLAIPLTSEHQSPLPRPMAEGIFYADTMSARSPIKDENVQANLARAADFVKRKA